MSDLKRFLDAQAYNYADALEEIKKGRKRSCWMWYVFPQIQGLGRSSTARHYEICDLQEARDYLADEVLGGRLLEICEAALAVDCDDAVLVFGVPDNLKLKSSMTLFEAAAPEREIFAKVLEKYFYGERDRRTLKILERQERETQESSAPNRR